jgi:flagellar assembly factor FliW
MTTMSISTRPSMATSALHFAAGVPGFPAARTFSVRTWGEEPSPFYVIDCAEVLGLRFVVVAPAVFFAWYQPRFGPDVYQAVDASGPEELGVLVILTLGAKPEEATANLLGPLVVNLVTGQAVQAVLSGSGYGAQTPLVGDQR